MEQGTKLVKTIRIYSLKISDLTFFPFLLNEKLLLEKQQEMQLQGIKEIIISLNNSIMYPDLGKIV